VSAGSGGPRARTNDLSIQPIGDELLLYDEASQRGHSLNVTATAVRACDGARSREQIAEECGLDGDVVRLALGELASSGLVADYAEPSVGVSRRAVTRRLAGAGAGLGVGIPAIRSITAPTAAMATANYAPCTTGYAPPPGRHPKHGYHGDGCDTSGDCGSGSRCCVIGFCVRQEGQSCYSQDGCSDGSGGSAACPASTGVCGSHCNS
jgi:hypothetical protein